MPLLENLLKALKSVLQGSRKKPVPPKRRSLIKKRVPSSSKAPSKKTAKRVTRARPSAKKRLKPGAKKARTKPVRPARPLKKRKAIKVVKARPNNKEKKTIKPIGEVTHFFPKIMVVVVKVNSGPLRVGDRVRIFGKGTDFVQKIASMQVESLDVKSAQKGQLVGLKVKQAVKEGALIYKIL